MARKSLTDRLRQAGATRNELDRSEALMKKVATPLPLKTEKNPPNQKTIQPSKSTKKGQDKNTTVSGQGHGATVTPQGHHCDTTVTPLFSPKGTGQGQDRDTISKSVKRDRTGTSLPGKATAIRLAKQQQKIYDWFLLNGLKGTFNKPLIVKELNIAYTTIRKALYKFTDLYIIRLNYDDCTKLFDYEINPDVKIKHPKKRQGQDSITTGTSQGQDITGTPSLISSSSLYNKPIIKDEIKIVLQTDPDLLYWKLRHLSPAQVATWIQEFSMRPLVMFESLKHCAFEMTQDEKDKPESYFYAVIKKAHNYARPAGYQSHQKRQNQLEAEILLQQEKTAKEQKELYKRRIQAEQDKCFYEMINDPECDQYAECLGAMAQFDRKRFTAPLKQTGNKFESAMRRSFEEIIDQD
jgi:hypothetical protein